MTTPSEKQFLQALKLCQSLEDFRCQPSSLPCQALELLCEVAREPLTFMTILQRYKNDTQAAISALDKYGRSVDNWRIEDRDCSLGFGVKDHCTIVSFLLHLPVRKFKVFTGNFVDPEKICELLKEWKEIDLTILFEPTLVNS